MNNSITILLLIGSLLLTFRLSAQDALTADVMMPTYHNDCQDGQIDLHITGGFSPYEVAWYRVIPGIPQDYEQLIQENHGVLGNNDGEDLENIGNDAYKVVVTDALCGTATKSFTITCACSDDCTLTAQVSDATCGANGAIRAEVNCTETGHAPFSFWWKDLGRWAHNDPLRNNLSPGLYCLVAIDKDDCEYEQCWTVENTGIDLQVQLIEKVNLAFCKGREEQWPCDGSLEIAVNSGASIAWQNIPNPEEITSNSVSDLCAGSYTVVVSLGACSVTKTYHIECCVSLETTDDHTIEPIAVSGEVTSATNATSMDGQIILTVNGGASQTYYDWTGPNGYSSQARNILNLSPGNYCVTVSDGCSEDQACFEIVDCSANPIVVDGTVEKTCDGVAAGRITLNITGGEAPYEVFWDHGETGNPIGGLEEGEYCASIKDHNGCEVGSFCFSVGSRPGEISTSTIPCARTIHCNGEDFPDYFEYEQSLDCNTLYSYCPVTEETIIQDLGWARVYVSNCNLYGVCQDGSTEFIENGERRYGPFGFEDTQCPHDFGCTDYACYLLDTRIYVPDPTSTNYCSTVTYTTSSTCPQGQCLVKIFCGTTLMASRCEAATCSFLNNPGNEKRIFDFSNDLNSTLIISDEKQLLQYVNQTKLGENERKNDLTNPMINKALDHTSIADWSIYPNPFHDEISIALHLKHPQRVTIIVSNVLGEIVFSKTGVIEKGIHTESVNLHERQSGIFLVKMFTDNHLQKVQKIVKY